MVSRTSPLNVRQVEVLKWIGEGCPDGVIKDFTYKTTAVAPARMPAGDRQPKERRLAGRAD
jgi:hypothetical protein